MPLLHRARRSLRLLAACLLLGASSPTFAGLHYSLDPIHAVPGETISVRAILANDTGNPLGWTPPQHLVLQWRSDGGQARRTLATLTSDPSAVTVPVNGFSQFTWSAVVPHGIDGLQAVNIEGSPALLALDASPLERSAVAGTPALAPVIVPAADPADSRPADPALVAAAGASMNTGPAAVAAAQPGVAPSLFDNFRNAISMHEPIYFLLGNRGGLNARFQLSFKYRLFHPDDPANPGLLDHLYLGYTQNALWDLASDSRPFIDTSYNPSLFWQKEAILQSSNQRWLLGLTTGVEHMSNGKDGDDSRSVNDVFLQPEFRYRSDSGDTLTFAPRMKQYFNSDGRGNPDYVDYIGKIDWRLRWEQNNGLVAALLYRQGRQGRNATQVDLAWPPKRTFLNMNGHVHVQYFQGYGETMLGYRHKSSPQVRIGLSLIP